MIDTTTQRISLHEERTWFTADSHFCHQGILSFCNRPFRKTAQMDRVLVDNLNEVIDNDRDTLVHLGDLAWRTHDEEAIKVLPGKHKILVRGNHDKGKIVKSNLWSRICDYLEITMMMRDGSKRRLVLSHYPMVSWAGARSSIHLHGHTHGCVPPIATEFGGRLDAGVDVWDFKPFQISEAIARLGAIREKSGFALPGRDY